MRTSQRVTEDICEVDFPPVSYGRSLEEVERTVQQVIERIFRDEDGIIRSGVYGKTMKPITLDEIHDSRIGTGYCTENHAMLNALKPLYMNYENAGQASGKYIVALLQKFARSGNPGSVALARRTFEALELFWNNVAEKNPYGRGWIPKPFNGIRDVGDIFECSPDQYCDITLGLNRFYCQAADIREKRVIEKMVLSFADWWAEHDYTTTYEGTCDWWKLYPMPHTCGFFLLLNALAFGFRSLPKYADAFDLWLKIAREGLFNLRGANASGLAVECLERLIELRPEHRTLWLRAAEVNVENILWSAARNEIPGARGRWQLNAYAAHHLCPAVRLFPDRAYPAKIRELISSNTRRADFYHVSRGQPVSQIEHMYANDGTLNMFWAESHVGWLHAYWMLKE
jgi:hypothetical protein